LHYNLSVTHSVRTDKKTLKKEEFSVEDNYARVKFS